MTVKNLFLSALLVFCAVCRLPGSDNLEKKVSYAGAATYTTAFLGAEKALAKSVIAPSVLNGTVKSTWQGEAFLQHNLRKNGNWHNITPQNKAFNSGYLFIKTDSAGIPTDLLTGTPGHVSDFAQKHLSRQGWSAARLSALGSQYKSAATGKNISLKEMPLNPRHALPVAAEDGRIYYFWTDGSDSQWHFTGNHNSLTKAKHIAHNYANYLKSSNLHKKRFFNISAKKNNITIDVYKAAAQANNLKKLSSVQVPELLSKYSLPYETRDDIARILQKRLGLNNKDARVLAGKIQRENSIKDIVAKRNFYKTVFISALWDPAFILLSNYLRPGESKMDLTQSALTAGSLFAGASTGYMLQKALYTPRGMRFVYRLNGPLRCSASTITSSLSGFSGSIVTSFLFSYGLYLTGYQDLTAANRQMIAGAAAAGTSSLFFTGAMAGLKAAGITTTLAGAGSATAAAGTSGAAVALGTGTKLLLGAVSVSSMFVVWGTTWAIFKYFEYKDQKEEFERNQSTLEMLLDKDNMTQIVRNSPYARQLSESYDSIGEI